jgi:hypothetical protein
MLIVIGKCKKVRKKNQSISGQRVAKQGQQFVNKVYPTVIEEKCHLSK